MPIVLLIIGAAFIDAGARGKAGDLWKLIQDDFSGDKSFLHWMVAIVIIGGIGYVDSVRPVSRAFLFLLIAVLFLSNGGFFDRFNQDFFSANSVGGKQP